VTGSAHATDWTVVHVGPALDARGGISSVLAVLSAEGAFAGYRVTFAPTVDATGRLHALRGFGRAGVIALGALIRSNRIYELHVASRGSFYRKALVFAAASARGHKTVLHLHGGRFDDFARAAGPVTRRLIRWMFCSADEVLVLSPEWRERVEEFSGRREAQVVPNPVVVPHTPGTAEADEVLFLGRVDGRKGVPELMTAIGSMQAAGNASTQWVIAGDGELEPFLVLRAELPHPDLVSFPGWMSRAAVHTELQRTRVFCLPSHAEGKPVALLEAMAYGVACVATPVGGVPDLLVNEVNGLLVPVGDADALALALVRLLADPALRRTLGDNARATVTSSYSVEAVSAALVATYDRLSGTESSR